MNYTKKLFFRVLDRNFIFQKIISWHKAVHKSCLNMDRQVCLIKTVAYSLWTDGRTDRKKSKKGGPKILSNDIFYFKTVIIYGPIKTYLRIGLLQFSVQN